MVRRWLCAVAAILALAGSAAASTGTVLVASYEGAIGPAAAEWIGDAIRRANAEQREALVLQLDTPGGLLESTRFIVRDIDGSSVPVIVYVAPSGARAASAGTFITLAAHVAAMGPGTRIGAAHPVELGKQSDPEMRAKMANDAAAFIRGIAESRGRNAAWAEAAVRSSSSSTEQEALAHKAIDLVAPDLDALMAQAHGRRVRTAKGVVRLQTAGARRVEQAMNWRVKALKTLTDPNIAYILLMIGIYGILYEIIHPGAVFPGVAGAISLIVGLYAMQTLPVNYAGVALLLLAVILFVAESVVPSGLLGLGGTVALAVGSLMLIRGDFPELQVARPLIWGCVAASAILVFAAVSLVAQARRRKPVSGVESMAGERGVAKSRMFPSGQVLVRGELWNARNESSEAIEPGEEIEVLSVDNLTLVVRRIGPTS